jgi:hypothetical protein
MYTRLFQPLIEIIDNMLILVIKSKKWSNDFQYKIGLVKVAIENFANISIFVIV